MSKDIREMIDRVKNFNDIMYKKSVDEDRTTITAYINNKKVGSLSMEVLFDAYTYEFDDVFDEDTFNELYPDSSIVKIEHIEVDDNYKNSGIGSELMKRGMELMRKNGYNQFYLNASPMGFKGLETVDLVNFYKKFGFKELLNQGHNVLMGVLF
jgi:GNAT superfamily N-acetyltransferase